MGESLRLSRRPHARTMSRRKQAKPQHINSEEDRGEQLPLQPAPEFAAAAAPAVGEPGEWGRTLPAAAFPKVRGPSRARAAGSRRLPRGSWSRELPGRRSCDWSSPRPTAPWLILPFYRFPSSPRGLSSYCKMNPHRLPPRGSSPCPLPLLIVSTPFTTPTCNLGSPPPSWRRFSKKDPGGPHLPSPLGPL